MRTVFQNSNNHNGNSPHGSLSIIQQPGTELDTQLGIWQGTNPSICPFGDPNAGFGALAFQGLNNHLWVFGNVTHQGDWDYDILPGTSPSICPQGNQGNDVGIAFQFPDNTLYVVGNVSPSGQWFDSAGNPYKMMPNTSPSICPQGHGVTVAFQAPPQANQSNGYLSVVGNLNPFGGNLMAPNTSPSICPQGGGVTVAYHGANDILEVVGNVKGVGGYGMAGDTSPSICQLGEGIAVAFCGADGNLWVTGTPNEIRTQNLGYQVMPGTSPSIAPTADGSWQVAFQWAVTGTLCTYGPTVPPKPPFIDWGMPMPQGVSPSTCLF